MYFPKKRTVAMILAGGQGSRLKILTQNTAKPAVPFGGKYRIIDFPLSNCVNSGIDTVGILTQYQPLELNEYIGNGQPWGLHLPHSAAMILPPFERSDGKKGWYKGTANAIYQNLAFLERYDPELVLILSGDHVYKMDYGPMLRYHRDTGADCTIAVRTVPLEEASRFGILKADDRGRITEFQEKPQNPASQNASMGIYVFSWQVLRDSLLEDGEDPLSHHDFGKNIIPNLLHSGHKLMAYTFRGYWKDVGTLESLWEANMALLGEAPEFDLRGDSPIYARNSALPSTIIHKGAKVTDSFIAEGSRVCGTVRRSVVSVGCALGEGSVVEDSVVMPGVEIRPGAVVRNAILGEHTYIGLGALVGGGEKLAVTGKFSVLEAGQQLLPGEMLV